MRNVNTHEARAAAGRYALCCFVLVLCSLQACGGSGGSDGGGGSRDDNSLAGGDTTTDDRTTLAFENPAANLTDEDLAEHNKGDRNFGSIFVSGEAPVNGGLGPLFNNTSCDGCHTKNGRGQPIFGTGPRGSQALLRISSANGAAELPGGPLAVPGLGTQLQDHAIFGVTPEGTVNLSWKTVAGTYGDGETYELRQPQISINGESGALSGAQISMRLAPPIFGAGLLEAVSESELNALADPGDANGDGISGRPNIVWDVVKGSTSVGRFGRKAGTPTVLEQTALAYANDVGIANSLFPDSGNATDITDDILKSVEFYSQTIAVPRSATNGNPDALSGRDLFRKSNCSGCHVERLHTGEHPVAALRNQTIFPYTDLLLHDMGEGLADNRTEFQASGKEWKTPALWGIGVTATILSRTATFLHDGRAGGLEEAILWHGGEAEPAKEAFRNMSKADRNKLVAFLRSL